MNATYIAYNRRGCTVEFAPLVSGDFVASLRCKLPADTKIQTYADDTVMHARGGSTTQVANELTNSMVHVTGWLKECCLQLNVSKTVCTFFTKTSSRSVEPGVFVSGERI